jgi:cytochrome c553
MKRIAITIAVLAGVCGALPALAGEGDAAHHGKFLADTNCTWCHGPSGQGFSTAPRLAGQKRQYLERQLQDLKTHARDNPFSQQYMWSAAAGLSPSAAHDVALYFSMLYAEPAHDGVSQLAPQGETVYREGIPAANVPSCVACHGPHAEGVGAIPRLGGQSYYYLKRKLAQWGEGYHAAAARPMPGVASKLSPNAIEALASYLSFVK